MYKRLILFIIPPNKKLIQKLLIILEKAKIEPPTVHEPYYPQIPPDGQITQVQTVEIVDNNNIEASKAGYSNNNSMETSEVISFDYTNNAFDDSEIIFKKMRTQ